MKQFLKIIWKIFEQYMGRHLRLSRLLQAGDDEDLDGENSENGRLYIQVKLLSTVLASS